MSETRSNTLGLVDLASARLGGRVLDSNDDFFAAKENLILPSEPVWIEGKYTDRGKWMDGWESRRRRTPGHDWCTVRLAAMGRIESFLVDTAHFTGNYPEACSVEAYRGAEDPDADSEWVELLPRQDLEGDSRHSFAVDSEEPWTHVRLNIFPDGGVARLRAFGFVAPDWPRILDTTDLTDVACVLHGGRVTDCSDRFYSAPENMLLPDDSEGMHDGWETKRRRGPGHDWCVIHLGRPGLIRRATVDTAFFRGNFPDRCSLDIANVADGGSPGDDDWQSVLPETALQADTRHEFDLKRPAVATHARLNIYPDGGVARVRLLAEVE